jgi:putative intracellular protease/amidase
MNMVVKDDPRGGRIDAEAAILSPMDRCPLSLTWLIAALVLCLGGCAGMDDGFAGGASDDDQVDDDAADDDLADDDAADDDTADDDSAGDPPGDDDTADAGPMTVAVIETGSSGVDPIESTLAAEGHTVTRMAFDDVGEQLDAAYDVIVYPGGGDGVWAVLDHPAMAEAIRAHVDAGGGFVGICGGAIAGASVLRYNGVSYPGFMIGLLDVEASFYDDYYAYIGNMTRMRFEVVTPHDLVQPHFAGDLLEGDYAGGPSLATDSADVLLTYAQDLDETLEGYQVSGLGALVAGTHGSGRVVLSAIHPEYNDEERLLTYVEWVRP